MRLAKSLTRVYSQVQKEILQIVRRPATFLGLVLGPFAIMALLALGYSGVRPAVETVLVIPSDLAVPRDPAFYQNLAGPAVHIQRVDSDASAALAQLGAQQLGLVVVAPADGVQAIRQGRQAQLAVNYNEIDPAVRSYVYFLASNIASQLNEQILMRVAQNGENWVLQRAGAGATIAIPPQVIAAPTEAVTANLAPLEPSIVAFFLPAVLALALQHVAVTLSALSFVRDREAGALELYRVSPVNAFELLLGRLIGFGLVGAVIAVVVTAGALVLVSMPVLGDPWQIALVIGLLTFASLGFGLLISVLSTTERQAVQMSLLLLLASVFFSGFVLRVTDFTPAVQGIAYLLPVTHGIRLLQDLMLRGGTNASWEIGALAITGAVLLLVTTWLLRRWMANGLTR